MPTLETETNYYALLGIDPGADAATIRKAVVGQQRHWGARQNAPDLATRQDAERHQQLLSDIRDVLLDPGQRALYDVQRVEALPDLPPPTARGVIPADWPRRIATHANWPRRIATLGVALVFPLFLATRATSQSPAPTAFPRAPDAAVKAPVQAVTPTLRPTPLPTRAAIAPRALPDEVPVTLTGMPLSANGVPVPTQPFSLAGGHYSIAWAVAGHQPCDFVITIADSTTPGLAHTTLSNHVLNRGDGQPAQGESSVTLNSGKYRLEASSDACAWSLTLHAAWSPSG